jgi:hypothetical protein
MSFDNNDLLAELLNSNVNETTQGTSNALAVKKAKYHELSAIGNLTSYSMQQVLHRCKREFQIMKLGASVNGDEGGESNTTFAFGHAVGAGVATYDETHSREQAIWAAFLAWDIDLFEEEKPSKWGTVPKKSFHHAVWALYQYETFYSEETDLNEYEVIKAEATVGVDFENGHFYIGHIDSLMRHKETGSIKVKENKTTSYASVDPAMYSNSDQALSYAIVADAIGATEYDVLYTIYSSTEQRWLSFSFTKSSLQKAEWLQSQTLSHSEIDMSSDMNFFPKNGDACIRYGRRCKFYEGCGMDTDRIYVKKYSDLKKITSLDEIAEIETVDYAFSWSELLKAQKDKL